MDALVSLLQDWGPAYLGWGLAAYLLWDARQQRKALLDMLLADTQAKVQLAASMDQMRTVIERCARVQPR